jgi:hypothetical protein
MKSKLLESIYDGKPVRKLEEFSKAEEIADDVYLNSRLVEAANRIDWFRCSFREVRGWAMRNHRLLEMEASSAHSNLLRAGVQVLASARFREWPTSFQEAAENHPSNKRQEYYVGTHGAELPTRIEAGNPFREGRVKGFERELINYKYMGGETFERELFDDDQSNEIRNRGMKLGEAQGRLREAYCAGRWKGAAFTLQGYNYPATDFTRVNVAGTSITSPFSVNFYNTSVGNRPATFGQLCYHRVVSGIEALHDAVDPNGQRVLIQPNMIYASKFDELEVRQMLESVYYPAIGGFATEQAASGSVEATRGAMSTNVLRKFGLRDLINPYFSRGEWYLCESGNGFVNQERDAMEVAQESPDAGKSFDYDARRFRSRSRFEMDWVDPSYTYQGNDGTAALSH